MDLTELGKVGRRRCRWRPSAWSCRWSWASAPWRLGTRLQHRAVRRRGAHRDQRRHHRPGVRRPPGAGHHRGPHRARRGRGRRRDGPRRADGRGAARDRGLRLGPLGASDRGRGGLLPRHRQHRRPRGRAGRCSPSIDRCLALGRDARRHRLRLRPRRSPSWPTRPSWRRSSAPSSPGSPWPRRSSGHRIRRELAPVGHLFIPVFFLEIGIDADISAFFAADVLRDAGDPARRRRRRQARLARSAPSARRATRS